MVNLLPQKKGKRRAEFNLGYFRENLKVGGALLFLVFTFVVYQGVVFYGKSLESDLEQIVVRAGEISQTRNTELEERAFEFSKKLDSIEYLLENHIYPSKLFAFIEGIVHPRVQITSFRFSVDGSSIDLKGATTGYITLAEQIIFFKNTDTIHDVKISNIKVEKSGKVSFSASFGIDKEIYAP